MKEMMRSIPMASITNGPEQPILLLVNGFLGATEL